MIDTLKGLKIAERLKRQGWIIGSVGFNTIEFFKKGKENERRRIKR